MTALLRRMRAWFAHPAKRRADDKRRLELLLKSEGLSRSAARRIAVEFFGEAS